MSDIHFKHVLGNERHGETAPKRVMFVKSKPFSMMPAEKTACGLWSDHDLVMQLIQTYT